MLKEKQIKHPLRTITLKYDDSIPESKFDKDLVQAYIEKHDDLVTVQKLTQALEKKVKRFYADLHKAEKEYVAVHNRLQTLSEEGFNLMKKPGLMVKVLDNFIEKLLDFEGSNTAYYFKYSTPLSEKALKLIHEDDFFKGEVIPPDDGEFEFQLRIDTVTKGRDSLDFESLQQDLAELALISEKIYEAVDAVSEDADEANNKHNEFSEIFGESQHMIPALDKAIINFQGGEHMLDASISQRFKNDPYHADAPRYFIVPTDEIIADNYDFITQLAAFGIHNVSISVPVEAVNMLDTTFIVELVLSLQHFPKLLDRCMFSFEIKFTEIEGSEIFLTDDQWKGMAPPMQWFHKMSEVPFIIFFLQDPDARAYFLMGDLFSNAEIKPEEEQDNEQGQLFKLEGEMLQTVVERLFNSCVMFMLYCHNTGFDAQPFVEILLAEHDMGIPFEAIEKEYMEHIKNNHRFKISTRGPLE